MVLVSRRATVPLRIPPYCISTVYQTRILSIPPPLPEDLRLAATAIRLICTREAVAAPLPIGAISSNVCL